MIHGIRHRIGTWLVNQYQETSTRKINLSLQACESVLVILPKPKAEGFQNAVNWCEKLKQDYGVFNVETLYVTDRKPKKNEEAPSNELNKTDLNWYGKPKALVKYTSQRVDLLIDLSFDDSISLKYVLKAVPAGMKVGRKKEATEEVMDFVIDTQNNPSVHFLTEQIERYLRIFHD